MPVCRSVIRQNDPSTSDVVLVQLQANQTDTKSAPPCAPQARRAARAQEQDFQTALEAERQQGHTLSPPPRQVCHLCGLSPPAYGDCRQHHVCSVLLRAGVTHGLDVIATGGMLQRRSCRAGAIIAQAYCCLRPAAPLLSRCIWLCAAPDDGADGLSGSC